MAKAPNPILFLALFVVTLLGGSAAAYWQFSQYTKAGARVASLSKELQSEDRLQAEVINTSRAVKEALDELVHLEGSVATIEYVPTLLKNLQTVCESCDLDVTGVRPAPPKPAAPNTSGDEKEKQARKQYKELDVEITCVGTFDNTMLFLGKLEAFPKIVSVRYVGVSPRIDSKDNDLEDIETTIGIRVYVFPEAAIGSGGTVDTTDENEGGSINLSPGSRGITDSFQEGSDSNG